jgi:hypothetical protein
MSLDDRIGQLDLSLFGCIPTAQTPPGDLQSLLVVHASLAARGDFSYLEVGSFLGTRLQAFIADPRCRSIVSIEPARISAHIWERLSAVPGADLAKLTTIDAGTEELDPVELSADLCYVDSEPTTAALLRDARFCREVIRDRGVIVFHDRTLVDGGIRQFLRELPRYRAYPLAHDLFVVEVNVPTLLRDPRVRARVTRKAWLAADRLRAVRPALRLDAMVTRLRANLVRRRPPIYLEPYGRLRANLLARARRPPVYLAVCAIFHDVAPYLAEWVAFHRLQGVERFWLYDHLSGDDWRPAVEPYSDVVDVTRWPDQPGQLSAYLDCLRRHRSEARWIAFIDLDEFLFSPTGRPLADVLREFERHPGVVANWRMYGTNGHQEPPTGLVIENYPMRGPDDHRGNRLIKSIVDPRRTIDFLHQPHYFYHYGTAVGEDHRPARLGNRWPPTADVLRINHYYSKSVREWEHKRREPKVVDGRVRETALVPPDEVRDETILQFLPALRKMLADRNGMA